MVLTLMIHTTIKLKRIVIRFTTDTVSLLLKAKGHTHEKSFIAFKRGCVPFTYENMKLWYFILSIII